MQCVGPSQPVSFELAGVSVPCRASLSVETPGDTEAELGRHEAFSFSIRSGLDAQSPLRSAPETPSFKPSTNAKKDRSMGRRMAATRFDFKPLHAMLKRLEPRKII